jgi:hypothetical protein
MKSINLKVSLLALSFFTFSAIFAQDTTKKPKPDTTNKPMPDTSKKSGTSMRTTHKSLLSSNVNAINSFIAGENKIAAKKEESKNEKTI